VEAVDTVDEVWCEGNAECDAPREPLGIVVEFEELEFPPELFCDTFGAGDDEVDCEFEEDIDEEAAVAMVIGGGF
jgi:hypothetical protein